MVEVDHEHDVVDSPQAAVADSITHYPLDTETNCALFPALVLEPNLLMLACPKLVCLLFSIS